MVLWGNCQHLVVVSSLLAGTPVRATPPLESSWFAFWEQAPRPGVASWLRHRLLLLFLSSCYFSAVEAGKEAHTPKKGWIGHFHLWLASDSSAGWGQVGTVMGSPKNRTWLSNEQFHFFIHAWMCRVEQWCSGKQLPRLFSFTSKFYLGEKKILGK